MINRMQVHHPVAIDPPQVSAMDQSIQSHANGLSWQPSQLQFSLFNRMHMAKSSCQRYTSDPPQIKALSKHILMSKRIEQDNPLSKQLTNKLKESTFNEFWKRLSLQAMLQFNIACIWIILLAIA